MPKNQRKLKQKTQPLPMAASSPILAAAISSDEEKYKFIVKRADVPAGTDYWRVITARHLPPEENKGRHNIFVDAIDEAGLRCRDATLRIGWGWQGKQEDQTAEPKPLDKPDNEPAGNLDIDPRQHIEVWIMGDGLPSDHVLNLHSEHDDERDPNGEVWNSLYHHSFHIVFQRTRKGKNQEGEEHDKPTVQPSSEFCFEAWPTEFRSITQRFGENPAIYKKYNLAGHEGIDIVAYEGSKIFCVAPGKVKLVHPIDNVPYGIHARIEHRDGYETIYGHMKEIFVAQGSSVAAGQLLGLADHTGNVIGDPGDHLHLSLKQRNTELSGYPGNFIDPMPFLQPLLDKSNNPIGYDSATYISDRFPQEVQLHANQTVTQSWTVRNSGTQSWDDGYKLVFIAGARMTAAVAVAVPATAPGGEATLYVDFQTPVNPGHYRSDWQMQNRAGQRFGDRLWFELEVIAQPQPQIVTTGNKLGFYIQSSQDVHDWISTIKPPVILIHAWDQGLLEEIRRFRSPDSFVIGRMDYIIRDGQKVAIDQPLVESWLDSPDPAMCGRALAEHILSDNFGLARRTIDGNPNSRHLVDAWMSLNESIPGPNSGNYQNNPEERAKIERRLHAYDQFQIAFRNKLMEHNIEAVAFNFGAGNFGAAEHYLRFFPETLRTYTYLGFHEYGWPALTTILNPHATSSAGTYRGIVAGLTQAMGKSYRVIITEAGLARMYKYPNDGVGDVGWLNQHEPLDQETYWKSLEWYNNFINQDQDVIGACLFQVGHSERWISFRFQGTDHQGHTINLLDRIATLATASRAEAPVAAAAMPITPSSIDEVAKQLKISGTVRLNDNALSDATVYLIGTLETVGSMPGATLHNAAAVTWSRKLRGFSGSVWNCWRKEVANQVAGINWQEFREMVHIYNPQLGKGATLQAGQQYFLPENSNRDLRVVWDRTITGFEGNLWQCWQTFIANRIPGLTYQKFRRAMIQHNPQLKLDLRQLRTTQQYILPHAWGNYEYRIQTQSNRQGYFAFDSLPAGSYQIEVRSQDSLPYRNGFSCTNDLSLTIALQSKFSLVFPLAAATPLPVAAASKAGHSWVGIHGDEFVVDCKAFRFIGVNIRGLIHYGDPNVLKYSNEDHRVEQVQAAYDMGARVVRLFLPCEGVAGEITRQRFQAVVNLVRERFPGLYLLPVFANLYGDVPFRVNGDDSFYDHSLDPNFRLLNASFFERNYTINYLPFVRQMVSAFRDEPIIFAWEVGNELKLNPLSTPDATDPYLIAFVNFMRMSADLIHSLDQQHLLTTGLNSTHHAWIKHNGLWKRLYEPFDFVTMHCYNEEYENDDSDIAKALGKPYIVEEAGFDKFRYGDDRSGIMQREVEKWFNLQARGYMPWGFMATQFDINDTDNKAGFSRVLFNDWEQLFSLFRHKADELASLNLPLSPIKKTSPPVAHSEKFVLGETVYCIEPTGLNLRQTAGHLGKSGADVIVMLKLGDAITITGGAQSKDGLVWWPVRRISTNGTISDGWVAQQIDTTPLIGKTQPTLPAAAAIPLMAASSASSIPATFRVGQMIYAQRYVNLRQNVGYLGKAEDDVIGQIVYGSPIEVISGPLQADGLIWWQVRAPLSNNQVAIGWAAEADGSGLQLLGSVVPAAPPPFTDSPLGDSFKVGDTIAILASQVNIRATPGIIGQPSEQLLMTVSQGTLFSLHAGPQMMDGLEWWQVATGQTVKGWVALTGADGTRLFALQSAQKIAFGKPFREEWQLTQGWGSWPDYYAQFKYDGVPLKGHNGLDFGTPTGTPLLAVDTGEVIKVDFEPNGFGNHLLLRHAWGESLYAHLQRVDIGVGMTVARGQPIGLSGESGLPKPDGLVIGIGPHLHFGVRIFPYRRTDGWGGFVDPTSFLGREEGVLPTASAAAVPILETQPDPMAEELPGRLRP